MPSNPSPRSRFAGPLLFFIMLAIAVAVLPSSFGRTMTVSPLLLFGVAVLPNFIVYLIPATDANGGGASFSRVFYQRVLVSVAATYLFVAIYRIAHALAAG